MTNKATILLDGDIYLYQIASKSEEEIRWDAELHTLHSDAITCIPIFDMQVRSLQKQLKAEDIVVALSDKDNFRKELFPEYKANRKDMRKPLAFKRFREHVLAQYNCVVKPRLEADDVLGILSTKDVKKIQGKKIIVSVDKDFESIPGWLYNPDKDKTPRFVDLNTANYRFYKQILTGDATDNYKGCYGIGDKNATKLLYGEHDEKKLWKIVVETFKKAGFDEEYALMQARMARILRADDYDFKKEQIKLWEPKK